MRLVADTGALISLACSRHFELLLQEHVFIVTPSVMTELKDFSTYNDFLGKKAQHILTLNFTSKKPKHVHQLGLEAAEAEAISLASEEKILVLTDDVPAARISHEKMHVTPKPSFYLLLLLYKKKKIQKHELVEDLNSILIQRNWLSGALGEYARKMTEEL